MAAAAGLHLGNWENTVKHQMAQLDTAETKLHACMLPNGAESKMSISHSFSVSFYTPPHFIPPSSCVFPCWCSRHDKIFPAFPESKPVQVYPQSLCQPASQLVSQSYHTILLRQECRGRVQPCAGPFIVRRFICNMMEPTKSMWKT